MRRLALLMPLLALSACTVGPDYHAPQTQTPAAFAEQGQVPQASATPADLSRWWAQLGDPELDSLVGRAMAQNLDLQTAASRVREAREQVAVARAGLFPQVSGSAVAARRDQPFPKKSSAQQGSGQTGESGGGGQSGGSSSFVLPSHLNIYSLGADATWEIDLFGGLRRGVEAARAQAEAAVWQARDSQVSLSAEVARAYLNLRLAQQRKATAQADVARLEDLMNLVRDRARAGVTTDLDVNQQRQALQARLAEIPQLDQQIRQSIHALGVLLGQDPGALDAELSPARPLPNAPAALPVGLPSDLLRRRPDVRAAERQLAAANAQIGVAVADLYPKLNLIGLASFAGTDLSSLLSKRNFSTIALGQGSWSLFTGGRTRATIAARREEAAQAELAWRSAVLSSLQDVEDALSAYAADTERERRLTDDLRTAQDTAALSNDRYRAGVTTFLDVLQAQGAVTQAEDQLLAAHSARLADLAALFTALGGGWSPDAPAA